MNKPIATKNPTLIFIYVFFLLYFSIGTISKYNEIFPFFSWRLFDTIPLREKQEYDVLIYAYNGEFLKKPVLFRNAGSLVVSPDSINAYFTMQSMGKAYAKKDGEGFGLQRAFFERKFLRPSTMYYLIHVTYSPQDRYLTGTYTLKKLHYYTTQNYD